MSRRSAPAGEVPPAADGNPRHIELVAKRARMRLIIMQADGTVLQDSIDSTDHETRILLSDDRRCLRSDVASIVTALIEHCSIAGERQSRIAFLDAHRFLRVTRLDGHAASSFAVSVEHFRAGDSLSRAARRYNLTPREIDVLAFMLEGASAIETALALNIAETTVQGYHKRLLAKTESRNRAAMVANVLDWDGSERRRQIRELVTT